MYAIYAYIGVVPGGPIDRHIFHTWSVGQGKGWVLVGVLQCRVFVRGTPV